MLEPLAERIDQISNSVFRIMAPKATRFQARCPHYDMDRNFTINGTAVVTIPHGCRMDSSRLSIRRSPVDLLDQHFSVKIESELWKTSLEAASQNSTIFINSPSLDEEIKTAMGDRTLSKIVIKDDQKFFKHSTMV